MLIAQWYSYAKVHFHRDKLISGLIMTSNSTSQKCLNELTLYRPVAVLH